MKILTIAAFLVLGGCAARQPALPVYGQIPSFELIAETGQPFDRKALDAKVWVADFIFTTCTGPSPRMTSLMRQRQQPPGPIPRAQLVSFTIHPHHNTPPPLP